jgi:hypothetical protein
MKDYLFEWGSNHLQSPDERFYFFLFLICEREQLLQQFYFIFVGFIDEVGVVVVFEVEFCDVPLAWVSRMVVDFL